MIWMMFLKDIDETVENPVSIIVNRATTIIYIYIYAFSRR